VKSGGQMSEVGRYVQSELKIKHEQEVEDRYLVLLLLMLSMICNLLFKS